MRSGLRIVHSLWSKPLELCVKRKRISGDWPSWKHYWYSWVLSAWQAHETQGRIDLVTDMKGAEILVEQLGLPYRSVSLALDELPEYVSPALWAYGKVLAYAQQRSSFLHIDSDVYLWKQLPEWCRNAPVIAQSFEATPQYLAFEDIYNRPRRTFCNLLEKVPPSWQPYAEENKSLNMGIFGGRDLGTIQAYCQQVREMVEHKANRLGWQALAATGLNNIGWSNMVVEQQTAYCVARQRGANIHTLFDEVDPSKLSEAAKVIGYTHVMGSKKKSVDHEFMQRLEKRVKEISSDAYDRIQEGFGLTRGCGGTKTTRKPSTIRKSTNVVKHVSHAGASVAKTSLGINRASKEQVTKRLAVCEKCPGDHAVWKNGKLYTCGPMLESMKKEGKGTCGCVLNLKARDMAEECPFGWW
ncbi:hypothetical protein KS4_11000 [Poriferisphaera corsica]|uniref:DUF6734 domain-containing protein n=1 Tax=Poriferisphaera corsica TaxID=2528020 RepID=A0A517YS54_9BACT|nr:DUF6734 family protein [Poriferisphaera corsica]QDU33059.1 hypothetical protein KS4_11000 [Poriferisphaera corsica]